MTVSTDRPTEIENKWAGITRILQSSHFTAVVDTESGSRYTVVVRPKCGVVLVNETTGAIHWGRKLLVRDGRLVLMFEDESVWRTTRFVKVSILTN